MLHFDRRALATRLGDGPDKTPLAATKQTAMEVLATRRRTCKALISYGDLNAACRKDFCDRAAALATSRKALEYMAAAQIIAIQFGVRIHNCDRPAIKTSISRRAKAHVFLSTLAEGSEDHADKENQPPQTAKPQVHSRANCGRKQKDDLAVPGDKLKHSFKGATTHQEYAATVKKEAAAAAIECMAYGTSRNAAGKAMRENLQGQGITIGLKTCLVSIGDAISNDGVALSPQKPGGCLCPV